jgi:hypothetical protein
LIPSDFTFSLRKALLGLKLNKFERWGFFSLRYE